MRLFLFVLSAVLSFIPQGWCAENTLEAADQPKPGQISQSLEGDFSSLKHTSSARVDKVIDAQTVLMKDGKIVRLLGIDYPLIPNNEDNAAMIAAKQQLTAMLPEGSEILLYQTRSTKTGRVNRMGHTLAHLVTREGDWINGRLVRDGFAYAYTDADNPQMAGQLYALEDLARKDKAGLWAANSPYGLLTPDAAIEGNGAFRVVEGTVYAAASVKNNLYLNFGKDWRKDFTVMVSPALRKELSRRGINPMNLSGQKVQVRGWIREWNGPFMELETAERLNIPSQTGQARAAGMLEERLDDAQQEDGDDPAPVPGLRTSAPSSKSGTTPSRSADKP